MLRNNLIHEGGVFLPALFGEGPSCWILYYYYYYLLYNIVLVLPYINMYPPQVYTCSPSLTPLPPPSLYHMGQLFASGGQIIEFSASASVLPVKIQD